VQLEKNSVSSAELGLLLLLGVLWGVPYALTKISLETIPPVTLTAARVSLAAATLWVFCAILQRRMPRWSWSLAGCFFIQASAACIIPYTLIAFGQQSVNSSLAAILNSATPLFVCLFGMMWFHNEPATVGRMSGAIVGLGGVALVVGASQLRELGHQSAGQTAILLATCSSAVSVIYGRRFATLDPEVVAAAMLTSAAVILIPAAIVIEAPSQITPSIASLTALAANGAIATALGFAIYFRLIRTIGSMGTASASYLKPAIGVLMGCAMLGETLTWSASAGLVAILFSVAAINEKTSLWLVSNITAYAKERLRGCEHVIPQNRDSTSAL
jgi:drug/metabolite transporter (DMT)-like permease